MTDSSHEDKTFTQIDYSEQKLSKQEFEACTFIECDFSKSHLINNEFVDCEFKSCNFSMTRLENSSLKGVKFANCKLLGVDFSSCNDFLFAISAVRCQLNYASFCRKSMKGTTFDACTMHEVDFSDADLTGGSFLECDLLRAVFQRTNLEKVDFRTAYHYSIDPDSNRLKKASFSFQGVIGLLDKYDIVIE